MDQLGQEDAESCQVAVSCVASQQTAACRARAVNAGDLALWAADCLLSLAGIACCLPHGRLSIKAGLDRFILPLLDRPSTPAVAVGAFQTPRQLDNRIHDYSISISSEPRSLVAVRCERGPDTHNFLPASSRAQLFNQRLSTDFPNRSAQLSAYQHTNIRQKPHTNTLSAISRSNHRNGPFLLWTRLHTSQLDARFPRRLDVTTRSCLHNRDRSREGCLRAVRA